MARRGSKLASVTKGGHIKGAKASGSFVNTPATMLGKGKGLKKKGNPY